ncbi:MAG TPA: uroporphyrinogen decarboxylase family protein [Anaerolineales bacterium]|nr:uroporphyrinogen decarboxylase family protein [Anaerolineales bacterium]
MNARNAILALLNGHRTGGVPCFSGLIQLTSAGLESEGLILHETHHDAARMARAAASTYRLTGFPSAAVPLDLYVEAQVLGAQIDFRETAQFEFPGVKQAAFNSVREISTDRAEQMELPGQGRVQLVCDAIRQLKEDIGTEAVIGAWTPGPFTLLTLLVEPAKLFLEMKREPEMVQGVLGRLSSLLSKVGSAYRNAGADFLTVHEMGGSPGFIGPARFEQFVLPALKDLIASLPKPRVLSICGDTNKSMRLLGQAGADAISVDQTNDLAASRAILGENAILFGNIDPVATLSLGSEADVHQAVAKSKEAGVDAVWPGCDLVVQTPIQNVRAMSQ